MPSSSPILLFDGVCNLCNGLVRFIIKHDKKGSIRFAALQSSAGEKLINQFTIATNDLDSLIFLDGNKYFIKSEAVFEIINHLGGGWKLLLILKIFPKRFCDFIYERFASVRYKMWGKRESCMIPTKELMHRFIE